MFTECTNFYDNTCSTKALRTNINIFIFVDFFHYLFAIDGTVELNRSNVISHLYIKRRVSAISFHGGGFFVLRNEKITLNGNKSCQLKCEIW